MLGEQGAGFFSLSCIYLLAMHTLICVTFSLPPGAGDWLRLLLVAILDFSVYLLDGDLLVLISILF